MHTITAQGSIYDFDSGHFISDRSIIYGGSYPEDYFFMGLKAAYLVGMSVPPVMTAQIATEIHDQWLSKI
jgi:DNA (cytosine-5)-methyltransferase 1